jgi:hypothetical protein
MCLFIIREWWSMQHTNGALTDGQEIQFVRPMNNGWKLETNSKHNVSIDHRHNNTTINSQHDNSLCSVCIVINRLCSCCLSKACKAWILLIAIHLRLARRTIPVERMPYSICIVHKATTDCNTMILLDDSWIQRYIRWNGSQRAASGEWRTAHCVPEYRTACHIVSLTSMLESYQNA